MKRVESEVVGSLFWLAIGVFFAVGGIKLNPGTFRNPGPGFLPLVMSSLLICFSLLNIGKGLMRPERFLERIRWRRQVLMVASVFFFGFLVDFIGFLFSSFILMSILFGLQFKGKNKWQKVLFYAAATALAGWLVFCVILEVPFPRARLMALWR